MIVLDRKLKKKIEAQAVASYPFEGCGLLIGTIEAGINIVRDIHPVPNTWIEVEERRTRFRIADLDMIEAEYAAESRGLEVIGIYHSHPDHPPVASARDLAWATWKGYSYLITGVIDGRADQIRSWQLRQDRSGFEEEDLEFRDLETFATP